MKKRMLLLVVFGVAILTSGAAAAPGTTNSPENSTDPASAPTVTGDPDLHIVDYRLEDGTMYITLYSEGGSFVSISAPPQSRADVASGYLVRQAIGQGEKTTISIRAPGGVVWLSSSDSAANGRFTRIDVSEGSFITGPWDAADVRNAGLGGAFGVALVVLHSALRARRGNTDGFERVA